MQKAVLTLAVAGAMTAAAAVCTNAPAAVTAQESQELKTTLMPLGGERKGNADGTIPAWTGGYTTVPPGYVSGAPRPDPFAGETPRLTITRANLEANAAKLSVGVQELFKRYPDFQIMVYPTHRTAAAPQSVYDQTWHNATTAQTAEGGNAVVNAHGGIPFPIPKTGNELLWNAVLHWQGVAFLARTQAYIVTPDGQKALASATEGTWQFPYYQDGGGAVDGAYQTVVTKTIAPAYQYGQAILVYNMLDPVRDGEPGWQYLVGQRRVRKAPNLQYDTPNFIVSGLINFDEGGGFTGAMDRYTWKNLGKREMYIPYNTNKLTQLTVDQQLGPHFRPPATLRWELHRVWVLEGDVAPEARHVVPKRVMYLDEDTWQIVCEDEYDASGGLWKLQLATPFILPELPAVSVGPGDDVWDFHSGTYLTAVYSPEEAFNFKIIPPFAADFFTPDGLAARGTR